MPGRSYSATSQYRYGFNGKENDKDISEGAQDYGMRIYDDRLGKFLSADPLSAKYPFYTPYSFAGNKPIQCIDLDGAEEMIPFQQSVAFDQIKNAMGETYVRGIKGDNLATSVSQKSSSVQERGAFDDVKDAFSKFLNSFNPISLSPIEPAPHVAQAMNFGSCVGSIAYEYDSYLKGDFVQAGSSLCGNGTVFLNISTGSEVGKAIVTNLRAMNSLKGLTDQEISRYVSDTKFLFEAGNDYSYLFWRESTMGNEPRIILSQIGPTALPLPPQSIPIVLPPGTGNPGSINTTNGSVMDEVSAISQEIATTLAPGLVLMANKSQNDKPQDGYDTPEKLAQKREALKKYQTDNNGKKDAYYKQENDKIITNEKLVNMRNKQKHKK